MHYSLLFSLFGPFLVWPIELLLPYPHFVEEIFKLAVVLFIINCGSSQKNGIKSALLAGVFFAMSETVLYIFKINLYGDVGLLGVRFLLTSVLHSFTFLVIYLGARKGYVTSLIATIVAIFVHWLYNSHI